MSEVAAGPHQHYSRADHSTTNRRGATHTIVWELSGALCASFPAACKSDCLGMPTICGSTADTSSFRCRPSLSDHWIIHGIPLKMVWRPSLGIPNASSGPHLKSPFIAILFLGCRRYCEWNSHLSNFAAAGYLYHVLTLACRVGGGYVGRQIGVRCRDDQTLGRRVRTCKQGLCGIGPAYLYCKLFLKLLAKALEHHGKPRTENKLQATQVPWQDK